MTKTPYPYSKNGKKAIAKAKKIEKNAVKKPITKIDKNRIYAWILLVLMAFWTFASVVSLVHTFGGKSSMSSISAGAEGVDYNEMTIDPFQYPTANLLNWPYHKNSGEMGSVAVLVNNDGTLLLNGTLLAHSNSPSFAINTKNIYFIPGATYTVSLSLLEGELTVPASLRCTLTARLTDGSSVSLTGNNYLTKPTSFLVPENAEFLNIYIYLGNVSVDVVFDNVRLGVMYNQGSTAYPYQPPYQLVYANGYNSGVDGQYDAGYNAGLQAGTVSAQAGIFNGLYADVTYWYYADGSSSETQKDFTFFPTIMKNRVDFSNITAEIFDSVGTGVFSEMEVQLRFKSGYSVPLELFQFYATASVDDLFGPDDYNKSFYVSTSVGTTTARFVPAETYGQGWRRFTVDEPFYDANRSAYVNSIYNFTSSYIGAFDGFQFVSIQDNLYSAGYEDGLNQGRKDFLDSPEYKNALANAQGKGYEQGKIVGYDQGVQSASDYSFFSLLSSVVDAPLAMFKDMFNFEILGVNLSNFALGLLTLAMVLGVVKLIL